MDLISFEDLVVQPYNSYFTLEKELQEVKSQLSLMEQRLKYLEEGKLTLEERIQALEVKYEELDDNRGKDNVKIHKDIKCINNDMKYVRNDMKCIKNRVDCLEYNESEREENEISLEQRLKYLEDNNEKNSDMFKGIIAYIGLKDIISDTYRLCNKLFTTGECNIGKAGYPPDIRPISHDSLKYLMEYCKTNNLYLRYV